MGGRQYVPAGISPDEVAGPNGMTNFYVQMGVQDVWVNCGE